MASNLKECKVGEIPTVLYKSEFISETEEFNLLEKIYEAPISKWKSLKNRRLQNWGGVVHEKGLLPQELPPWLTKITQKIHEESGLFPSSINHVLINEYLPGQGIMPHQDGPAYFPVVAILSLGSPVVMDFTPHSRVRASTGSLPNNDENKRADEEALELEMDKQMDNYHPFSVLLMPRSLLIFKDNAYSDYLHGIKDSQMHRYGEAVNCEDDLVSEKIDLTSAVEKAEQLMDNHDYKVIHRTTSRVSLTCRTVLKVHKNLFKF